MSTKKKLTITLIALALVGVHKFLPGLELDAITLFLLIFSALPWMIELIKEIDLPGIGRITLQDVEEELESVSPDVVSCDYQGYAPTVVIEPSLDPELAVVNARIEVEKRVREISLQLGKGNHRAPLSRLIQFIRSEGVIDLNLAESLEGVVRIGNRAAHGEGVDAEAARYVYSTVNSLLFSLDKALGELK